LSHGYAVDPEQSTVAIVAHHPQAVYFGMKSGRLPKELSPDQIIADPRRRTGHRVRDGIVRFDDDAGAEAA
jgi:5-methyltetrahydrofolate--homocysteine methyltransferase